MTKLLTRPSIVGHVTIFQMDENRNVIEDTIHKGTNTIKDDMFDWLAKSIGEDVFEMGTTIAHADIIDGWTVQKNNMYKVIANTVIQDGVTYPVGSYFINAGTAITGTGDLQRVQVNSLLNPKTTSQLDDAGSFEDDGMIGYDTILVSDMGITAASVTQQAVTGFHGITDRSYMGIQGYMATELNQGGDGDETYIEFYGELLNDSLNVLNLNAVFDLVKNCNNNTSTINDYFEKHLAQYAYNAGSLAVGRRLGIYWRFNFAETV